MVNRVACRLPGGMGGQVRNVSAAPAVASALGSIREIELSIGGMTCAACAARVEKKLNAIGPEVSAAVNFATAKAMVTAPAAVSPHALVTAVKNAGYAAQVVSAAPGPAQDGPAQDGPAQDGPAQAGTAQAGTAQDGTAQAGPDDGQAGYLRRRLILALVFFVPLSDTSIMLSLFPAYRFAGWQWVLVVLAAPVALWAAAPFHRPPLVNARHGACSMDTLVSLGVVAAFGWSVYAMFQLDRTSGASALQELAHASGGGIS